MKNRRLRHNLVLIVFTVYVPSNRGLRKFNDLVRSLFSQPLRLVEQRGEKIPFLVAEFGEYGWTGKDLYQDYLASGRNSLRQEQFVSWPEENKPKLCLLGPEEDAFSFYSELLEIPGCLKVVAPEKYTNLVQQYFWSRKLQPRIYFLEGQVERQIRLGKADLAIDIVCSGKTAKEERLVVYDTVFNESGLVLLTKDI